MTMGDQRLERLWVCLQNQFSKEENWRWILGFDAKVFKGRELAMDIRPTSIFRTMKIEEYKRRGSSIRRSSTCKKIQALASYRDYTYAAYGHDIEVLKRAHQIHASFSFCIMFTCNALGDPYVTIEQDMKYEDVKELGS
ncbi:hypothetical protein QVD17_32406 [Tagetes erecta]|uniref:Uncharacterized protein n=1 Tax=Tagetes erecta TaxID=13708 RepID=A0AAD8K562_TARER|nr:hypothetical protein QVD17_32406 [Tagetes erecta]